MNSPCERCNTQLPIGATHSNAEACVLALRARLESSPQGCAGCSGPVKVRLCPSCAVAAYGTGLAKRGLKAVGPGILARINSVLDSIGEPDEEAGGGEVFKP